MRTYRSPLRAKRAAETRNAVLASARRLFLANGWAATAMRDVAADAGIATETLYSHFTSKRALLQGVIDVAAVGDGQPLAVADRPEFAAIGRGSHRARTAAAARLVTEVNTRLAPMAKVIREAAGSDDEIAVLLRTTRERQRIDVSVAVGMISGAAATVDERDGVWAITSPEIFTLLVEESGWTAEQYGAWMTATLERIVPRFSTNRR